jgi:hypothetical protein
MVVTLTVLTWCCLVFMHVDVPTDIRYCQTFCVLRFIFDFVGSATFCDLVRSDSQNVINSDVLRIYSCWRILSAQSTLILLVWQWKKVHRSIRKEITVSTKGSILWTNCLEHILEDLNFVSRTMMSLFSINWELQQGALFQIFKFFMD